MLCVRLYPLSFAAILILSSCGGSSVQIVEGAGSSDGGGTSDASSQTQDGSTGDESSDSAIDGTPMHTACARTTGTAINGTFGRLDGFLRSIVPPGQTCGGDADHVHLRVEANGLIYDFAVNVYSDQQPATPDVYYLEKDAALTSGSWAEGWHSSGVSLDYPTNLKVAAGDFKQTPTAQLASSLEATLQSVNHISVYGSPYTGTDLGSGADKIHRNGGGTDGALVVNPTTASPHFLLFHFSGQSF